MNRTLQQLKESVEKLIEQQGADASCAAFIFTKEDVFEMDDDGNEVYCGKQLTNKVLNDLDETDYILEKAFDRIEEFIKERAWHLHFHWRRCDSSRTGRCHLHWHHRGAMLHSLLQFSPEEMKI